MLTNAIVRTPGRNFCDGITTSALGRPDRRKTLEQHAAYCDALRGCGVEVSVLEADERFPDGCFVEDTAVVTEDCAVIARVGAPERRGEEEAIADAFAAFRPLRRIEAPGTLDGGDVMRVGDHFYVGLSQRTDAEGARQLASALSEHGHTVSTIPVSGVLHLKTGVTFVGDNTLVATDAFAGRDEFKAFNCIDVDKVAAANCLDVNGTVLVPAGFPSAASALRRLRRPVIELDISEFRKMDGGLTCLSLLF